MTPAEVLCFAGDGFDGDARLLGGFVGQQNAAGNVANGKNKRIGRFLLIVDLDEAAFVLLNFGVFQTEVPATRHAPHGNEHAIVKFLLFHLVRP